MQAVRGRPDADLDILQTLISDVLTGTADGLVAAFDANNLPAGPTSAARRSRQPRGPQPTSTTESPGDTPIRSNSHAESSASSSA